MKKMIDKFDNNVSRWKTIIFLIPVLLYANSIGNEYALDDSIVITQNEFVQQGIKGIGDIMANDVFTGFFKQKKELLSGGRYRPLSLVTFALEKQMFGSSDILPHVSHAINVLLFAWLCMLIFTTTFRFFKEFEYPKSGSIAFVVALLFAVHPIHTEVVANIKGRDEIMALLFAILTLQQFLITIKRNRSTDYVLLAVFFLLGLLSKEIAVAIMSGILLIALFYVKFKRAFNIKKLAYALIVLFATFAGYMLIRISFVGGFGQSPPGELMNNPFIGAETGQVLPTKMFVLLQYIKLLLVPHPLTYDYYPYHIELKSFADPLVILSLLIHVFLISLMLKSILKEKAIAFGLAIYFTALLPVSNLLFNVGIFMNERFVFFASYGFIVFIAAVGFRYYDKLKSKKLRKAFLFVFSIIIAAYSIKVVDRNPDWKDNYTLFTTDVKVSSESAKGNCTAGGIIYERAIALDGKDSTMKNRLLDTSLKYLAKAVKIYPEYKDAWVLLQNVYFYKGNMEKSLACFRQIPANSPQYKTAKNNLKYALASEIDPNQKIRGYKLLHKRYPDDATYLHNLGSTYGKELNEIDSALYYLNKARELKPDDPGLMKDLGVAHAIAGNTSEALGLFEKLIELSPSDPDNYKNLGLLYQRLGQVQKAKAFFEKAEALKAEKTKESL